MSPSLCKRQRLLLFASASGLSALFIVGIVGAFFLHNIRVRLANSGDAAIELADSIITEVNGVFRKLERHHPSAGSCTPAFLERMRAAQFESDFVKDVGFFDGNRLADCVR